MGDRADEVFTLTLDTDSRFALVSSNGDSWDCYQAARTFTCGLSAVSEPVDGADATIETSGFIDGEFSDDDNVGGTLTMTSTCVGDCEAVEDLPCDSVYGFIGAI